MRLLRLVILLAAVAVVVFPAGMALAYPPANPIRALPATVERGETFNVTVNFTAPANNFTAISITDFAPDGWNVTVDGAWCQPTATAKATGNMAELSWHLISYGNGTNFTARYKVTVPCGAELGNYTFGNGFLGYYIGPSGQIFEDVTGDFNVTVVPPAICSTSSIDFYTPLGQNPENQTLQLWSSTPCMINWTLSDDADWLSENRTSGNCTDVHRPVTLSVNSSSMSVGDYSANITINATEANNSPRIVPVSLHISAFGTLKGHVDLTTALGAAPKATWVQTFVVKGFAPNSTPNATNALWTRSATTDEYGVFIVPDLDAGTYDIGIKNCTCLSELETGVVLTVGYVAEVYFAPIREGDCDENDMVTAGDRGLLYDGWNSANIIQQGHLCDLNRDGGITAADRGLLYDQWNTGGAAYGGF